MLTITPLDGDGQSVPEPDYKQSPATIITGGNHEYFYHGVRFEIHPHVFSPERYPSSPWFVDQLAEAVPTLQGKKMIEVGCGSGFAGQYLTVQYDMATLLAGDIDRASVECARHNSKLLGIRDKVAVMESDVYNGFPADQKADIVYWNCPWVLSRKNRGRGNRPYRDAGYRGVGRFIEGACERLLPNGRVFLGFGAFGKMDLLGIIAAQRGLEVETVAEKTIMHGRGVEETVFLLELHRPGMQRTLRGYREFDRR